MFRVGDIVLHLDKVMMVTKCFHGTSFSPDVFLVEGIKELGIFELIGNLYFGDQLELATEEAINRWVGNHDVTHATSPFSAIRPIG